MAIQIGAKPESDFNNPLGLLSDCHRRIEKFLDVLLRVAEQAQDRPLEKEQREALEVALRYFRSAAPLHTQDEETSLFPRMRAVGSPAAHAALEALEALEADHRQADAAHDEVDRMGRRWLDAGSLSAEETERLTATLRALRETYRRHIAIEDNQVFPLAGQVLEETEISALGREMAERRGLDPDNPSPVSRCEARRALRESPPHPPTGGH